MKKKQPEDNMELEVMRAYTSSKSDQEIGMPDVEQELARLKARRSDLHRMGGSRGGRLTLLRKVAAILVAALMLTGLSYAAVRTSFFTQSWNENTEPKNEAVAESPTHPDALPSAKADNGSLATADSLVLFNNIRLDSIMMQIDRHYQVTTRFTDESTKGIRMLLRWNPKQSLDEVLNLLNGFERLKVRRKNSDLIIENQ